MDNIETIVLCKDGSNFTINDKESAFLFAAQCGNFGATYFLLNNGVNVHYQDDQALFYACGNGYIEIVKLLVSYGADVNKGLAVACQEGHEEVVKILLKDGLDYDEALGLACQRGHLAIVKLLCQRGANIHSRDEGPLLVAIDRGHVQIVEYLLKRGANGQNGIIIAVENNNIEMVKLLRKFIVKSRNKL